jgi:hypothetical protein
MSNHPADQARRQLLQQFVQAPIPKVVAGDEAIPAIIGIKCINRGSVNKLNVRRVDRDGQVFQRYQAQPVVRELRVGYLVKNGQLDRSKPVKLMVNQAHELMGERNGKRSVVDVAPDSPLRGRSHGSRQPIKEFLAAWEEAFARYCTAEGIAKVFRIRQGCVIEKEDGTRFQFRNFARGEEWMAPESFRNIRRVYRSPLGIDLRGG